MYIYLNDWVKLNNTKPAFRTFFRECNFKINEHHYLKKNFINLKCPYMCITFLLLGFSIHFGLEPHHVEYHSILKLKIIYSATCYTEFFLLQSCIAIYEYNLYIMNYVGNRYAFYKMKSSSIVWVNFNSWSNFVYNKFLVLQQKLFIR